MYRPQYLNVQRRHSKAMGSNTAYFDRVVTIPLGWRKKPPEKLRNKSGRRFAGKDRWSEISQRMG